MLAEPRREEYTIWTAIAPEAPSETSAPECDFAVPFA
jgi:hypothetical protein